MKNSVFKTLSIILVACFAIIFVIFIVKFQDGYANQKFSKEISAIPRIKTKIISTFEGAVSAQIEIPNKGNIDLIYGIQGLEYIRHIGKFDTTFICPENQTVGVVFNLGRGSKFQKWFPFQVNNLQELVNHYDDIVAVLKTFPNSPNPDYTVTVLSNLFGLGKKTVCSIYFK